MRNTPPPTVTERVGFALLLTAAIAGACIQPRDIFGWLLLVASFPLFLCEPSVRSDSKLRWAIWFVLCAHHAAAMVFAWSGLLLSVDAESFHKLAMRYAGRGVLVPAIDFEFYAQVMGAFYRFTGYYRLGGGSRLLAAELSVFGFAWALFCFIKLVDLVKINPYKTASVLLFGCLPAVLIYTSIPLRESWELVLLMTYCYLLFVFIDRPRVLLLAGLFPVMLLLGMLHKGLILYVLFLSTLGVAVAAWLAWAGRLGVLVPLTALLVPAGLAVIVLLISKYDLRNSGVINYLLSGKLLQNLEGSRALIQREHPRSAFPVDIDFSGVYRFVVSYLQVYFYYLFAPLLWSVENLKDVVASLLGVLRLTFLVAITAAWYRRPQGVNVAILLIIYVSMTMLWALGTTNYGQAFRHHVLTDWVLVLIGVPCLVGLVVDFRAGATLRRQPQ